jgi:hypothetical protein
MNLKINGFLFLILIIGISSSAQINWINVDSIYQPLPSSVHVFKSIDSLDGKPNISLLHYCSFKRSGVDLYN